MRIGEKVVIIKIHNKTKKGDKYVYRCDVGDSIQNTNYAYGVWELFYHKDVCIITDLDLAEAKWEKELETYTLSNVANPKESIIKVLDFCYERRSVRNEDGSFAKNRNGITKYNEFFCIYDCEFEGYRAKSLTMRIKDLQQKTKAQRKRIVELQNKNRQLMKQNYEFRRQRRLKKPTVEDEVNMLLGTDQQREEYNEYEEIIFEDI